MFNYFSKSSLTEENAIFTANENFVPYSIILTGKHLRLSSLTSHHSALCREREDRFIINKSTLIFYLISSATSYSLSLLKP